MSKANYEKSIAELYRLWVEKEIHKDQCFIKDGILDYSKWVKSKKILIILKEAYSKDENEKEWSYSDLILNDKDWVIQKPIFKMICCWLYVLNRTTVDYLPEQYLDEEIDLGYEYFCQSAVINIKKSKGVTTSNKYDLVMYAREDSNMLKRQIEIVKPKIILYGYTSEIVMNYVYHQEHYSDLYWTRFCYEYNNQLMIDFWHPARKAQKESYYSNMLAEDYQEYLRRKHPTPASTL